MGMMINVNNLEIFLPSSSFVHSFVPLFALRYLQHQRGFKAKKNFLMIGLCVFCVSVCPSAATVVVVVVASLRKHRHNKRYRHVIIEFIDFSSPPPPSPPIELLNQIRGTTATTSDLLCLFC